MHKGRLEAVSGRLPLSLLQWYQEVDVGSRKLTTMTADDVSDGLTASSRVTVAAQEVLRTTSDVY